MLLASVSPQPTKEGREGGRKERRWETQREGADLAFLPSSAFHLRLEFFRNRLLDVVRTRLGRSSLGGYREFFFFLSLFPSPLALPRTVPPSVRRTQQTRSPLRLHLLSVLQHRRNRLKRLALHRDLTAEEAAILARPEPVQHEIPGELSLPSPSRKRNLFLAH